MRDYEDYLCTFFEILEEPEAQQILVESANEFYNKFPEEADKPSAASFAGFVLGMLQMARQFTQDYTQEEIDEMRAKTTRQRIINAIRIINHEKAETEDNADK